MVTKILFQKLFKLSIVAAFVLISGQVNANSEKNFDRAMASAMAFSSMFPKGQTQVTQKEARTAEKHLSKAVKYASKLSVPELTEMVDKQFAQEFRLFTIALRSRLEGWKNVNKEASIQGIRGMERFRVYYNKNRKWIYSQLSSQKKQSSWITWEPKKGELLPRIGCDKGAVIAWLAGC